MRPSGVISFVKGFTLVEMAIVLVIIGLVVAGVLVGQDMIHAGRIRSTVAQANRYITAASAFYTKFNHFPGDMSPVYVDLFALHGDPSQKCLNPDGSNVVLSSGSSSGSTDYLPDGCQDRTWAITGNGRIDRLSGEDSDFYVHLSRAGMIEGTYSLNDLSTHYDEGKIWAKSALGPFLFPDQLWIDPNKLGGKTAFLLGLSMRNLYLSNLLEVFDRMEPQESYGIDSKMDDGNPNKGRVLAIPRYLYFQRNPMGVAPPPGIWDTSILCCTGSPQCADSDAQYDLSKNVRACTSMIVWGP